MAVELILVRHGQSEGNVAAEAADRDRLEQIAAPARDPDVMLSETGRTQAAAVGAYLSALPADQRPGIVWTSPYQRARETAEIALHAYDAELDFRVDERLRDRDMGITDMLTGAGIRAKYPEEAKRRAWIGKFYYRPPGGESWADVAFRVRSVLTDLANSEKHDRVLVTAHDVVILLFCYVAEGMDEKAVLERATTNGLRNAAICRIRRDEDSATGWTVTAYNEDSHLRDAGVAVTSQPGASDEVGAT
ncbi:histidine phosphatase family protein [Nostocoides australiense]|nr:histidine phosphatase family protein [Actinomycetota bacterium]MCB1300192.1 histidine phosphatase family protein [Tetrasphaera sp.]HPF79916.1 histidine phosphatase family protein [Tetrasphaera australiensis]HRW00313.1 histidine phosphatase family protein [Tetrasphaera sp.]